MQGGRSGYRKEENVKKHEEMRINGKIIYFKALEDYRALDRFIEILEYMEMYFCGNTSFKGCSYKEVKKKEKNIRKFTEMHIDGEISVMEPMSKDIFIGKFMETLQENNLYFGGTHTFS